MSLAEGDTLIGRSLSCHLHIADNTVSRRHAMVHVASERVVVRDLDSHNGTFVNGRRVDTQIVVDGGDELVVGNRHFHILVADDFDDLSTGTMQSTEFTKSGLERRRHERHPVQLPIIYSSVNLTVESTALDLSRSGVFVSTPILDEVGTQCELTVLVEDGPGEKFRGRVSRVVESETDVQPLGLGIEFCDLSGNARRWLDNAIARAAAR